MLASVVFDRARLAEAASDEMIAAVDIADLLVREGVPFREAHGVVASLVRAALDSGRRLSELSDAELAAHSEKIDPVAFRRLLDGESWLESKVSEGGTASERVTEQLTAARRALTRSG